MTPERLEEVREAHERGLVFYRKDMDDLLAYVDEMHETIAALRAGQGTPTGDTR